MLGAILSWIAVGLVSFFALYGSVGQRICASILFAVLAVLFILISIEKRERK